MERLKSTTMLPILARPAEDVPEHLAAGARG
jgi:hypothetical protein